MIDPTQPYKKNLRPYFITGIVGGLCIFVYGNWFLSHVSNWNQFWRVANWALTTDGFLNFLNTGWQTALQVQYYAFIASILFFLICMWLYTHRNDRGTYRLGEEHGSARFATIEEMSHYRDVDFNRNRILSKHVQMGLDNSRLPLKYQKNKNVCVIGDSGSGKTFTFVKPNLMQMNGSFIVTDPKGLLIRETGKMLEESGYKIKVFDLNTLSNSDQFNIFHYIKTEIDIDRVLEAITESTKKGTGNEQDFWIQAEALLTRALLAYLWIDGQDNEYMPHLGMIGDMLRHIERKDPKKPSVVEVWFEEQQERHPNNYAYRQWSLFNDLYKGETRMSVYAILSGRYSVFDHSQVRDLVKRDTMEVDGWNEEKYAVFMAIPETSDAYNFLSAMFMATAMETLRYKVDRVLQGELILPKEVRLLHVSFIFDEFANMGKIPHINKALATFRSRNMSIVIILQALEQLKSMYKNGWASMLNNCATLLFLGGDEKDTTSYLSQRVGKQTISIRNTSESKGRQGNFSESKQKIARDLLTPDEIGRLDGNDCLVFISKEFVFKDKKYTVFEHSKASALANKPEDKNWYRYIRYKNDVEELLANIEPENIIDMGVVE